MLALKYFFLSDSLSTKPNNRDLVDDSYYLIPWHKPHYPKLFQLCISCYCSLLVIAIYQPTLSLLYFTLAVIYRKHHEFSTS